MFSETYRTMQEDINPSLELIEDIFIQGYIDELRVIGRLAAVLFLFAAIESLKHTQLMLASDPFSKRRNFLTFWFTLYKLKP